MARRGKEILLLEQDGAFLRLVEPAQAVEERGLAGAVGADEAADRAALDLERNAVERHDPAEADADLCDLEDGLSHASPGPFPRMSGRRQAPRVLLRTPLLPAFRALVMVGARAA